LVLSTYGCVPAIRNLISSRVFELAGLRRVDITIIDASEELTHAVKDIQETIKHTLIRLNISKVKVTFELMARRLSDL